MKYFPFFLLIAVGLAACSQTPENRVLPILGERDISPAGDTAYPKVPDFAFVDQDSQVVTNATFAGKIYVVDFFFIHCPTICPKVKKNGLRIYEQYKNDDRVVLLSHSIDTRNDTVAALKRHAAKLGLDSKRWHLVTGEKDAIYGIADDYFSVATEDPDAPGGFDHSGRLILIALDPEFALAHALLATTHISTYWWGFDATAQRRDQAKAAADTALRLQPDLAEAHYAMGMYFYFGFRDYERALKQFDEALALAPNSAEARAWSGFVQRRQGSWGSALASLQRAAELDPRNANTAQYQGDTYLAVRQYAKAAPYFERAFVLTSGGTWEKLWLANFQFLWKGDSAPLKRALAEVPPGVNPGEFVTEFRIALATYEGRYADAIALLKASSREGFAQIQGNNFEVPKDFYIGEFHTALGDAASARTHFLRARERLKAVIAQEPDGIFVAHAHAMLGLTHAYLGERDEALRNAERALELLPVSRDALDGPWIAQVAAATRLRLGDHDRALAELGRILGKPGGPDAHVLRRHPEWEPLWDDPRFQKLIAENLPVA